MKFNIILIAITILMYSCSSIKTENIKSTNKLKKYSFFYNLPKTELQIKIKTKKKTYIPGPYKDYAKKYLGINLKHTDKKELWQISDISIKEVPVIDTSKYFVVNYKGNKIIKSYTLSNLGFLSTINCDNNYKNSSVIGSVVNKINDNNKYLPDFTNNIIKPIFVEKIDTSYKTVYRDSITRRIPVYKKSTVSKDIEKRAEDAAKFIIKIRKRRLRVLTAMDKDFPKGNAAGKIIKKLDDLEKQYLELFIGKTKTENYELNFTITPQKNKITYKVCNFSKTKGFSNKANKYITLKLTDESFNNIDSFLNKNIKSKKIAKGIFYRLPKIYKAELNFDNKKLLIQDVRISQFGNLVVINKDKIKNNKIFFDTTTGAIKSIK